ncbi:hypothetical protein WK60_10760 [Burkholderia ubonensis]|uniref:hypothetical protein n=1 Tax=Burkholderia ubonensis TaxID=101571 RepID=UPI0007536DC3|nr:hypothetical protein [Burkholderia ubonensis]KVT94617.1 hypothetical protein WK60_10760 [Burkholderia ubonensis]
MLLSIKSFDRASDIVQYSTDKGVQKFVARDAVQSVDRGYFMVVDGRCYGVFATPAGPVAFLDAQQWLLKKGDVASELIPLEDGKRKFVLKLGVLTVYEVVYKSPGVVVDNWSDDESVSDFFSWLHSSIMLDEKGRFFEFYKLSP